MKRTLAIFAVFLAAIPIGVVVRPTNGAEGPPPTVSVVGLMVNMPIGGGSPEFPELAFFGTFDRTSVALKLDYPPGGLIDLRREDSTLTMFADDHGNDLRKLDQAFGPFEMNPRVAEDGKSLVFIAASKSLPHGRCNRLLVKGEVAALRAETKLIGRARRVEIAEGTRFSIGPYSFEVSSAGPSEWSEGWSVTLVSNTDLSGIVRYALVDASDNEVPLQPSMSIAGGGEWQQTLECERSFEQATFLVEYWESPEVVGQAAAWLAQQSSQSFSGRVVDRTEFGKTWGV